MSHRLLIPVALAAVALAGCGSADGGGGARVLVTSDFGARVRSARIVQSVPAGATAATLLAPRAALVGAGSLYVNGIERDERATAVEVHGGDRVWWDRHASGAAPRASAVVGSFPEPFLHGADGKRFPIVLECARDAEAVCATVGERLAAAGAQAARQLPGTGAGEQTLRVLVGPWSALRGDAALSQLDRGPRVSGVYARFADAGHTLELLDARGAVAATRGPGAGLVAATRFERQAPTWAITGTDLAGVAAAARALSERRLEARFALAVGGGADRPLPLARP